MAVFTPVALEEVQDFFKKNYGLGAVKSIDGILQGVENTNYHVFTEHDRYILTLYEYRTPEKALPFIFEFTEHLANTGLATPITIKNTHGLHVSRLKQKPAAVISFLKGHDLSLAEITPDHCAQMGSTIGKMHLAARNFKKKRDNIVGLDSWSVFLDKISHRSNDVEAGLYDFLCREVEWLNENWPHHLPSGAVHADLFPDNVFFEDGKLTGLIDFYFACTELYIYDLAIAVNAWCFDENAHYDQAKGKALLDAYEGVRPLSDLEKGLFPTAMRGAAMRILMTRLHDYVFTPKDAKVKAKDPLEYVKKLKFSQNNHVFG